MDAKRAVEDDMVNVLPRIATGASRRVNNIFSMKAVKQVIVVTPNPRDAYNFFPLQTFIVEPGFFRIV